VVTGARFIEGLRRANGTVAGTIRMAWPQFVAFNALGATYGPGSGRRPVTWPVIT
jgi:membrane protein DedA with SNARE-associated domain